MKSILVFLLLSLNVFAMDILPKKYELKFIYGVNTLIFEDLLETNGVNYQDQTFRVFGLENCNILSRRYIGLRTTVYTENGTFKDRANTNWLVRRFSR